LAAHVEKQLEMTLVSLQQACVHVGLVSKSVMLFDSLTRITTIIGGTCMQLLGTV
jgi:hypothetical protein